MNMISIFVCFIYITSLLHSYAALSICMDFETGSKHDTANICLYVNISVYTHINDCSVVVMISFRNSVTSRVMAFLYRNFTLISNTHLERPKQDSKCLQIISIKINITTAVFKMAIDFKILSSDVVRLSISILSPKSNMPKAPAFALVFVIFDIQSNCV